MDLVCTFCGSTLEVYAVEYGGTVDKEIWCTNFKCNAEWHPNGTLMTKGIVD